MNTPLNLNNSNNSNQNGNDDGSEGIKKMISIDKKCRIYKWNDR